MREIFYLALFFNSNSTDYCRLNVDALRSFSSTIIHVDFYLESPQLCKSDHLGESRCALVTRSCRLAFKSIRAAGFSSVVVNCTSDVQRCVDPLAIAIHIGLIGVYGEIDSFVHSEMQHALSSQMFLREAELRCRVDFEQGKTLSLAPGFVDSALLCPLVLIKYKCFLHSGFSWNRDTVLDIIGHSADIHMLEEVINLLLFTEGNGSLLTAVPKEASEGENKKLHQQDKLSGNFNGLQKSGSSGSQQGFQSSLDAQNESSNGFYFWRKQASSDASAALASPAVGTTMTHSEFVMALLTCSGAIFESREPEPKSNFRQPLFEYSNSACGLNSPSYRKSPSSHSARAHLNSPHLHRSAGTSVDSLTFAESESLFWRFLGAKTCDEFVTCGHSRTCEKLSNGDADGYAPSKAQALEVLKYYRRALASVGWKLDRKKMAALRESGMSGDNISTRAQWGADMIANKTVRGRDGETKAIALSFNEIV